MSAETVIRFSGDEAFLNTLTNPQPLARPAAASEVGMPGSAGDGTTPVANAFSGPVASIINVMASTVGQLRQLAQANGAGGFSSPVGPDGHDIATGTAVGATTANEVIAAGGGLGLGTGMPAKVAATGHDTLDTSAALLPLGASVAAVVASVSALTASVKNRADAFDGQVDRLGESSPQAAGAKDFVDINREFRRFRRGDGLKSMPDKGRAQENPFEATATDIGMKVLHLLSSAWETSQPLLETMRDTLVDMSARLAELCPVVVDMRDATKATAGETHGKREKDDAKEAARLARDQEREAGKEKQLDNGETSEQRAQKMADGLMQSLGLGAHGPRISPSRR